MYQILIVDDEAPALRFLQAIINKYASEKYTVACACQCAADALSFMAHNPVDLLLTDISMPEEDGISLAMRAREMYPELHIVIISGYAEFDYAKGAIRASVDDYILKPVSIPGITGMLDRICAMLDEETAERRPRLLSALLSAQPYDAQALQGLYPGKRYFALVRWGNLYNLPDSLSTTSLLPEHDMPATVLSGRDEDEQLIFSNENVASTDFQSAVKAYVSQYRSTPTWTIIFGRNAGEISSLPAFFAQAVVLMDQSVSIGYHRFVFLTSTVHGIDMPHIASTTLKKLEYFIQENNARMIKNVLISLAADWEKRQLPQIYVSNMVQQLINLTLVNKTNLKARQSDLLRDTRELLRYAASYGDLIASVYAILFEDNMSKDKKTSAEDLYGQAITYIHEHYAEQIGISTVCSEIGISQTYLSRLFRKYGNTSFTAFLTQYRIESAMQLIQQNPDILLRDVSICVGYDDSSYFSKVFHQLTGKTPSQYVAQQQAGASPA